MLLKFKIINIPFIFFALIFAKSSFANNQTPIISLYNFENNLNKEYYKIIKNTVFKELNDKAFLTEDGNRFFKFQDQNISSILNQINFENENNADIIIFLNLSFLKISENKFFLNLKAEIYNVKLENFITSWSTPTKEINFTKECDNVCKNLEVTKKLVLMASQLGENVSKILSLNYQQKENKNFIQQYNLIISGLNNNEIISLTDIMINEFPGFVKLINKEQYGSNYKYKYFSSANNLKIKKWLIIALNQLNLSEEKNIEINVNSNLISINKYPSNLSSGSKGNPKKFN